MAMRRVTPSLTTIFSTVLIGATLVWWLMSVWTQDASSERPENSKPITDLFLDDHVIGNRNAPYRVTVYTDLECPYCKTFNEEAIPRLQQRYGEKLAVVFRHFPLTYLHPKAYDAALIAECVYKQGGDKFFLRFIEDVYARLDGPLTDTSLDTSITTVGLSVSSVRVCSQTDLTIKERVERDYKAGALLGISKTPTSVFRVGDREILFEGSGYRRALATMDYLVSAAEEKRTNELKQ
jgi:protein-disulfide isomerase